MKIVLIALATLIIGYIIGSFFPVRGFFAGSEPSIAGNSTLQVTVLRPDKSPATNLEVDIATTAGQVYEGGHELTDSKGVATFKVKPDTYNIFFNAINFPANLKYPESKITTQAGQTVSQTVNLEPR